MKILLLGEYSNVHNTLAEGLRQLGHQVTVASNGDFWKNYPRDIDLQRTASLWGKISFAFRLLRALPKLRGYDVVQLINPLKGCLRFIVICANITNGCISAHLAWTITG